MTFLYITLRQKFKEINILTVTSQYIFDNVIYVKKNIVDVTKIVDVDNINTRNNRLNLSTLYETTLKGLYFLGH